MDLRRKLISVGFLALLGAVMPVQVVLELKAGERPGVLALLDSWSTKGERDAFETSLRRDSFLRRLSLPSFRSALLACFREGNSEAQVGREGWLYLKDDVDLVCGPAFSTATLEAAWSALTETRDELRSRGIELVVVPIPNKASEVPGFLAEGLAGPLPNPGRDPFLRGCRERGLEVVSPGWEGVPRSEFLPRDTHWTPASMESFALTLAERVRVHLEGEGGAARATELRKEVRRGAGDLVNVLGLRPDDRSFDPMDVEVRVVDRRGEEAEESAAPRVLLLGDSFCGVFSDGAFGFGEQAGLAEHLGHRLGEAVDSIVVAGGGAVGSRRAWARRLGGDAGILSGSGLPEVVVWQFSMRDLALDPAGWPSVSLFGGGHSAGGAAKDPSTLAPGSVTVLARVTSVSEVPDEFDYDFCLSIHRFDVLEILENPQGSPPLGSIVVAGEALVDRELTDWARLRPGDRRVLTLEAIGNHHDLERTAAIDSVGAVRGIWFPVEMRREE